MDINELRGLLEPSAQDRQDALSMGLLGLGSGLLANSTGHYGQFAPAMGRGLQGGLQGYQTGMQNARENRMQDISLRFKLAEIQKQQEAERQRKELLGTLTPEQQKLYALGGGDAVAKTMIPKTLSPSDVLAREKFEWEKRQGGMGTDANWQTVQTDQGLVQVHPKTGQIRPLGISKPLPPAKQLTEGQAKATTYASQMQSASNQIQQIESGGFQPTGLKEQLQVGLAGGITNIASPAKAQQYKQAQEQWAESFLRAKTGAAATREEVEMNRKTFFPQAGDSPEVVQQKTLARAQAERDVLNMAGAGRELATPRNTPQSGAARRYNPETGRIE